MLQRISLFLFVLLPVICAEGVPVRVCGSDLLAGVLGDAIAAYQARHPDAEVELQASGTVVARESLASGNCDFAVIAIPDGSEGLGDAFEAIPFGFDVITVLVNVENPLKEMSLPALASIYGARETKNATHWGDLGLEGSWSSRTISVHLPDSGMGIYRNMFERLVLDGRPLKQGIAQWDKPRQLLDMVGQDGAAISVVPGVVEGSSTRALFLASEDGGYAYPPKEDSIYFGDYPLRLPYMIVVRKGASSEVLDLAAFLLEDDVAQMLQKAGLVAVPQSERRAQVMQLAR